MKQTRLVPFDIEKAKQGAKVVTRRGLPVRITDYAIKDEDYPILALIDINGKEEPNTFTTIGKFVLNKDNRYDLFIEEDVDETDDYNPYKATVESIDNMVKIYAAANGNLRDFYNEVKVKCREAIEYDKKWCKNQDEKPADNKPKFQKGDWVIDIDKPGVVHQITDVIKNVTNHTYGYNAVSFTYGFFGYSYFSDKVKSMRLWTIQDAKPGDILASKDDVFIFKHMYKEISDICDSYCEVIANSGLGLGFEFSTDYVYPATKKQRDLLFQKMKEAGYEWDSDKKELHKIEKVKTRRMTNQELSWWLHDHPEEHREMTYSNEDNYVSSDLSYLKSEANIQVYEKIVIRKNGGEWQEPLIEE